MPAQRIQQDLLAGQARLSSLASSGEHVRMADTYLGTGAHGHFSPRESITGTGPWSPVGVVVNMHSTSEWVDARHMEVRETAERDTPRKHGGGTPLSVSGSRLVKTTPEIRVSQHFLPRH